ncbi:MAG: hypothetical protein KAT05_06535, partial [Spirochaetes bacterium]|nr:hypothetical protein [Spirochaetota bacterium]
IVDFVQTLNFAHTYREILGKKLKGKEISIDTTEIKEILSENLKSIPVLIFSGSSIPVYRFLVVNLDLEELAISWADAVTIYINYLVIRNYVEISDISDIEIIRPENYTELLKLKEFIEELLDNE